MIETNLFKHTYENVLNRLEQGIQIKVLKDKSQKWFYVLSKLSEDIYEVAKYEGSYIVESKLTSKFRLKEFLEIQDPFSFHTHKNEISTNEVVNVDFKEKKVINKA